MHTIDDPEMAGKDLSPLFGKTYCQQQLMATHHPGQASWVWRVDTTEGPCIVRTSRFIEPPDEDFWQGAWRLFGAHTASFKGMLWAEQVLAPISPIPLPRIRRQEFYQGRRYLVVDYLPGIPLQSFNQLSNEGITAFGRALAIIHGIGKTVLCGTSRSGPFHTRAYPVMEYLVSRFYAEDRTCQYLWKNIAPHIDHLPPEDFWSPILLDMDPSQFLTDGSQITALVDTELYVMAPRHLELIGLEYLLDAAHADRFREGYETISPLPNLCDARPAYRFLLRLLSFQGAVDWTRWMNHPTRF